jgi:hypothetical protein
MGAISGLAVSWIVAQLKRKDITTMMSDANTRYLDITFDLLMQAPSGIDKTYSAFFQVLSGSNFVIALAIFAVSFPKSF